MGRWQSSRRWERAGAARDGQVARRWTVRSGRRGRGLPATRHVRSLRAWRDGHRKLGMRGSDGAGPGAAGWDNAQDQHGRPLCSRSAARRCAQRERPQVQCCGANQTWWTMLPDWTKATRRVRMTTCSLTVRRRTCRLGIICSFCIKAVGVHSTQTDPDVTSISVRCRLTPVTAQYPRPSY